MVLYVYLFELAQHEFLAISSHFGFVCFEEYHLQNAALALYAQLLPTNIIIRVIQWKELLTAVQEQLGLQDTK